MRNRLCIGITMGDPAGIGAEIIVKSLAERRIYELCTPVVFGDYAPLEDAIQICNSDFQLNIINTPEEAKGEFGIIDLINFDIIKKDDWEYKKPQKNCGNACFQYIVTAIKYAMNHDIDAIITAPINKEALHMAGYKYAGHTEIFAEYTHTKKYGMMLANGPLRVIHVSTHVSLREACDRVKKDRILEVIKLAEEGCRLLGIDNPVVAVAGLNPHSSENGLFGKEEDEEIIPAINEARSLGIKVVGPEPPDTVFVKCLGGNSDIVVAMYHDQGHIPLKLSGFRMDPALHQYTSMSGINCTIGLPIIRTSVDHGTAYGKAGEGRANADSMLEAIFAGIQMSKGRKLNTQEVEV